MIVGLVKIKKKSIVMENITKTSIPRVEIYDLLLKMYMKVSEITNVVLVVNRLNVKITWMVTSKEYKKAFTFGTTLTKHINVIHTWRWTKFQMCLLWQIIFSIGHLKRTRGKIPWKWLISERIKFYIFRLLLWKKIGSFF